jgi:hypothetical protein
MITFEGARLCVADVSLITGLPINTIHNRLNRGLSDEDACSLVDYRRHNRFHF